MLLMLSARHFLWVPEAWPGRRSETRLRQRGSRNKRQKEEAAERAAADGAPVKGACVACSAVQQAGGAARCRVDPRLRYVVGRVLFCLRGARTTSGNTGR